MDAASVADEIQARLARLAKLALHGCLIPTPFASYLVAGAEVSYGASILGKLHQPAGQLWAVTLFPDMPTARRAVPLGMDPSGREAWLRSRRDARQVALACPEREPGIKAPRL